MWIEPLIDSWEITAGNEKEFDEHCNNINN
jgi:hypothetical protein